MDLMNVFKRQPTRHLSEPQAKLNSFLTHRRQPLTADKAKKLEGKENWVDKELENSAKKTLNNRLIKEELDWFQRQSMKEIAIKVIILAAFISILYSLNLISLGLGLCSFVCSFFLLTTNKKFYKSQKLYYWAKASLFASGWAFSGSLLTTFTSLPMGQLIISFSLNILLSVVYFYQPAIQTRKSYFFIDSMRNLKKGLIEMFVGIFHLKQVMGFVVLLLFLLNTILNYLISTQLFQGLTLVVLWAFLLSFIVGVLLMYVILWYEELTILPMEHKINKVHAIITLFKLDPSVESNQEIHERCLHWVFNFILFNPNAIKAYPYHSKFYSTYWDIFKEYSEKQISESNSHFVRLREQFQHFNLLTGKNKSIRDDLFIWFKQMMAQVQIHFQMVRALKQLSISDAIVQIYYEVEKEKNVLPVNIQYLKEKIQLILLRERVSKVALNKMRKLCQKLTPP